VLQSGPGFKAVKNTKSYFYYKIVMNSDVGYFGVIQDF